MLQLRRLGTNTNSTNSSNNGSDAHPINSNITSLTSPKAAAVIATATMVVVDGTSVGHRDGSTESSTGSPGIHHPQQLQKQEKQSLLAYMDNDIAVSNKDHRDDTDPKDRSSIVRQITRNIRTRWNRLSYSTKRRLVYAIITILLLFWIVTDMIDMFFPKYGIATPVQQQSQSISKSDISFPVRNENEFAVVINTYRRPLQLQGAVRHYAETCGRKMGIQTVYIIWAEENVTPPTPDSFFPSTTGTRGSSTTTGTLPIRSNITILPVQNSLNSRFLPIPNVQDIGVFMVDDDIRVDCISLQRGYQVWKLYPQSMVGYYPRLAVIDNSDTKRYIRAPPKTNYIYQSWPIVYWYQQYNFVLTKAAFIHPTYMTLYSDSNTHPTEIMQYIDTHFNCEDVAMSLLVANMTHYLFTKNSNNKDVVGTRSSRKRNDGVPVIYIEGTIQDVGLFNGISTGSGHMERRSKCLSDLSFVYKEHGWGLPFDHDGTTVFFLQESAWRHHMFWWQYRPANIFEWLALSNIFK